MKKLLVLAILIVSLVLSPTSGHSASLKAQPSPAHCGVAFGSPRTVVSVRGHSAYRACFLILAYVRQRAGKYFTGYVWAGVSTLPLRCAFRQEGNHFAMRSTQSQWANSPCRLAEPFGTPGHNP
jgi:hypothetical protein